jgi:hypothetical protein
MYSVSLPPVSVRAWAKALTIQRLGASEHIGLTIMTGLCQGDSRHRCDCVYSMEVCSSIASPAQSKRSKEGML